MGTIRRAARVHRTIWYMGAKSRVIPGFLDEVLAEELEPGDTVADLMSGSGVVSAFCASRYRVVSNDVQSYAAIIARSLLEHSPASKASFLVSLDPATDLDAACDENRSHLERALRSPLQREAELLEEFGETGGDAAWARRYRAYLTEASALVAGDGVPPSAGLWQSARRLYAPLALERRRRSPGLLPASLATTYWGNVYYGLRQAVEIDSLRAAIAALPQSDDDERRRKVHYLSALLHAASVTTSGTSHFAQPRHLTKDSELRALAKRRSLDVRETFETFSDEIADTVRGTLHLEGNRALAGDYRRLIDDRGAFRFPRPVDLVYVDPPYTADNYSRFYHVLEVLARYDYPELERGRDGKVLRGRYPVLRTRFRSGFCSASGVEREFRTVISATARAGAKLVISYSSPTGLLLKRWAREVGVEGALWKLRELCQESYRSVRILERPLLHSGQGDSNLEIVELLVVCTQPR